jgi:hypothetical protein
MVYFLTKNTNGNIKYWYIFWPFGIFDGHFGCLVSILNIFLALVGMLYQEKSGNPV